jgi:hypothetical protein
MPPPKGQENGSADKTMLKAVGESAGSSNKLLKGLADKLIELFKDKDLPLQIKILLVPLLFIVPVYSVVILIFIGEFTYCLARSKDFHITNYLFFMGGSLLLAILMLLVYAVVANKFENTRTLELQLKSVTEVRAPRRKRAAG